MTIAKGKCLTHVRMKVMAVLRLMLSETNSDGRKLCCEAWQAFVKNLQLECLTSLLPQIVVSILPMTKSDLLSCTPLLTDIFVTSRNSLKKEIDQLAFVINVPEYSHLKKFLPNSSEIEKNLSLQVLVERCLEMLQNENPEVKALALGKLLNVLEQNQRELHRLILDSDVIDDFICTLVDSLIKTIRYDSAEVKLLTAKCLGLIGAIDPGKLDTDWSGETTMRLTVSSYNDYTKNDAPVEFPVQLLAELARVLSSVPDGAKFNACSYAIQEILKYFRCTPDEVKSPAKTLGSRIWEELSESLRETIEPMLTSR